MSSKEKRSERSPKVTVHECVNDRIEQGVAIMHPFSDQYDFWLHHRTVLKVAETVDNVYYYEWQPTYNKGAHNYSQCFGCLDLPQEAVVTPWILRRCSSVNLPHLIQCYSEYYRVGGDYNQQWNAEAHDSCNQVENRLGVKNKT